MSINQAVCNSFIKETLQAVHNFGPSPDTFKCALYTESATLNANTTVYTSSGEVVGTNYTAGGRELTVSQIPIISGSVIYVSFANLEWPEGIDIAARGALIYNASKDNKAVCVVDFGLTVSSHDSGQFMLEFPPLGPSSAFMRVS